MSPEVSIRRLPVENQGATRDGACKVWRPGIGSYVVESFGEVGGGSRVLMDSILIPGGGIVGGQATSGHAFMGILSHRCRVEYPVAFN